MDVELSKKIKEVTERLSQFATNEEIDVQLMDPVAKMMLVALLHECQKIRDYAERMETRVVERFCDTFIPRDKISATPAILLLQASLRSQRGTGVTEIGSGAVFSYKLDDNKQALNYIPFCRTKIIPYHHCYVLTPDKLRHGDDVWPAAMNEKNCLWLGLETEAEVESFHGVSLFFRGVDHIMPSSIQVGTEYRNLSFVDMSEIEGLDWIDPFDAQQASHQTFAMVETWKQEMMDMDEGDLIYITDEVVDRDLFKPHTFTHVLKQWLENEALNELENRRIIWMRVEFPKGFVVDSDCDVVLNVFPAVNVEESSVTLTQAAPIAKLQKGNNSFFLQVKETSNAQNRQGFGRLAEEIIIRDFDASCYHDGDLYRDVRELYNHFIDDYYAFIEYNGIKDGETIRQLRETINKIGKSVGLQNDRFRFDSGTYVMRNMNQASHSSITKVSFLTTSGKLGNRPVSGTVVENKKLPQLARNLTVVVSARGGTDKAGADERYELLRYYTLTGDRLYTRKDIEAFARKEIMAEFGKDEYPRVTVKVNVEGAAGERGLVRGLYVDFLFKDKKNYDHAVALGFDRRVWQKIRNQSCISMSIHVCMECMENQNIDG